jgi:hypothetical protein
MLYGNMNQAPSQNAPGYVDPDQEELAEQLYPQAVEVKISVPLPIQQQREADPARKLYGATANSHAIPESLFGGDANLAKICRQMSDDLMMDNDDISLYQRIAQTISSPPDDETRTQWHEQAVNGLNQKYGMKAASMLDAARRLVSQDPMRGRFLDIKNLGDHPEIIMMMASLAERAMQNGRMNK